jgi:signal transduction histidine kinase
MEAVANGLEYATIAAFAAIALICLVLWRRRKDRPAFWAFVTFAALAAAVGAGPVNEALGESRVVEKAVIVLIVLFPYLLHRFAASFAPARRALEAGALAVTAVVAVWGALLPEVPESGPRPTWLTAFIVALLVQWSVLLGVVAVRLWLAGRRQPSVIRNRMRVLAGGSVALALVLLLAGAGPTAPPEWYLLVERALTVAAAVLFFVGFAPPRALRKQWRGREEELFRHSIDDLFKAAAPDEVATTVLPQMANLVGARAVALVDEGGAVLASHGIDPDDVGRVLETAPDSFDNGVDAPVRLRIPSGSVLAWTSAYAPFFGSEEFELLHALGGFAYLALDRARLFTQERDARLALERADEVKSQFIALASHELRSPAAVIHGIASTVYLRAHALTEEQLQQLRHTLYEQTGRLSRLVDQLLDLSRLEAAAIPIEPEPLPVRNRVQELVLTQAPEQAGHVEIDVPPDLQAVVDPNAFDRIVANLIANALRYGEPPVRVEAEQRDRHFRLTVEDHGRGVAPDFVPRLFDRFSRSADSDPGKGGAGLGLAIAQSYAHAHGGELLYEDARPHGARFQLVIPRAARQ